MLKEFKKFITRGNVIDLAVGMIIGGAFTSIVSSLVNDIFMPILGGIIGKTDFTNFYILLSNPDGIEKPATLAKAQELGLATINIGNFITAVLHFLIMAFIVFLFVRSVNRLKDLAKTIRKEEEPAPTTKKCPYCKSEIAIDATRCPHCTSEIE